MPEALTSYDEANGVHVSEPGVKNSNKYKIKDKEDDDEISREC